MAEATKEKEATKDKETTKASTKETDKAQSVQNGKQEALQAALAKIEKSFGKGSVMKFGDKASHMAVEVVPTGALSLDLALGIGGVPRGRIIEIYGPESSGKTTLTLHIVAEIQKMGGIAAFIDAEHALDPVYAKKLGVNIEELYISQPDDGEQALEICDEMVRSGAIDIIVVDSVAALVPRAEIEGEMGSSHMGLHARLMSQALRKLTAFCNKNNVIILFTNQLREKIGVSFGNPETTTGGRALKFYASVRLDIRKAEAIKIGERHVGNRTKVKVAKNKVAPPFRVCEFDIVFGEGISHTGDLLDLAVDAKIANKSGSWYSFQEERIGQGRENAKTYLKEHPEMCLEMEELVRKHFDLKTLQQIKEEAAAAAVGSAFVAHGSDRVKGKKAGKGKKGKAEEVDKINLNEIDDFEDDVEIDTIIKDLGFDDSEFPIDEE